MDFYRSLWILLFLSNRFEPKCFFIILAFQAKWCKQLHEAWSFLGKSKSLQKCLQGNQDQYMLFFRVWCSLPVSECYKSSQTPNLLMPPYTWNGIPNHHSHHHGGCSSQSTSGRCSTQALAFQPWGRLELYQKTMAIFFCQVLLKLLLDPDFFSLLFFWVRSFRISCHCLTNWKQSSHSAFLFMNFSIVLSKLVSIWHVMSSLLSSGPLVQGIIYHVEIWNRSMLHLLVLCHPL